MSLDHQLSSARNLGEEAEGSSSEHGGHLLKVCEEMEEEPPGAKLGANSNSRTAKLLD